MVKSTPPSLRDQQRRNSTSRLSDGNPPPLPTRKLSDLPPLNRPVEDEPPPLPSRHVLRQKAKTLERPAPDLPVRDRSSWTPPNDIFEQRFKFHRVADFPPPEPIRLQKKSYPSEIPKKGHKKPPSPPPPPPEQTIPPIPPESPSLPTRDESPPPPPPPSRRKSKTDHSIFGGETMKVKM